MVDLRSYERAFGITTFYPHQVHAFNQVIFRAAKKPNEAIRVCLYYPTGKGKTKTALVMMNLLHQQKVLVIAPPSTHRDWVAEGMRLNMTVDCISAAKFRQPDYNVPNKHTAIIVDEFHQLGGRKADGWKKLDRRIAPHLEAPLIICSATPSYNSAERVYCVHHVLDPVAAAGGYDQYQLEHCLLEVAYRGLPNVVGFHKFKNAAEFLSSLPGVYYMDDTAKFDIEDTLHTVVMPPSWRSHNYDERTGMMMHSLMTRRVSWQNHHYLADNGDLRFPVAQWLYRLLCTASGPVLIYCDKTSIAEPTADWSESMHFRTALLTGSNTTRQKERIIDAFKRGELQVLVATATLATGTDGLDKVCDELIILQDTQDDSLRRQLVGRILPRGDDDGSTKKFHRMLLPPVPKK